jgi:ribonuclease P protein component
VKEVGRRARTTHFGVNYAINGLQQHRLGLIVQKRFWNAVQRSRIKRCLREWFRLNKHRICFPAKDIVVIARPGAERLSSSQVAFELSQIFASQDCSGS